MPQILIAVLVIGFPLVLLFGWIADVPRNVKPAEGFFELAVQWLSAFFHVLGPVVMLSAGLGNGYIVFGTVWAIFGSLVLARRAGALWSTPGKVYLRDWWHGLGIARTGTGVGVGLVFLAWMIQGWVKGRQAADLDWGLDHTVTGWPWLESFACFVAFIVLVALYVTSLRTGNRARKREVKTEQMRETFTGVLSKVFNVPQAVIDAEAGWKLNDAGHLIISPVPAAMRLALSPASLTSLDEKMSLIYPDWQIDPDSGYQWIGVMPVTDETLRRRAELERTDGLYVAEEAPQEAESSGSGTFDMTDGAW